ELVCQEKTAGRTIVFNYSAFEGKHLACVLRRIISPCVRWRLLHCSASDMLMNKLRLIVTFLAVFIPAPAFAQTLGEYLEPFPAHHVIGNIYFVGSRSLGIYLITTKHGHILLNAGLDDSVPGIQKGVESLGFKFSDVRILLISHAHFDHDAGAARIKKLTGAK